MNVFVVISGELYNPSTVCGIFRSLKAARDYVVNDLIEGDEGYQESDCPPNYWRVDDDYITIREYPVTN